ncbi:MAG: hypothetical protein HND59_09620 [Pseudomonadota bacterium]|nr:MAG: hypothetical protein HND59_09620 [Pseudomonadota bacterium]
MDITQLQADPRTQVEVCQPPVRCGRLDGVRRARGAPALLLAVWVFAGSLPAFAIEMSTGVRDDGRAYWRMDAQGFQVELVQLQPNQVRAFYIARGFSAEQAESLAVTCLMQMIVRNAQPTGAQPIQLPLAHWGVHTAAGRQPLRLTGDWDTLWDAQGTAPEARLAFRWALFPVDQTFHPGDGNWGMITTGLAVGTRFDLLMQWMRGAQTETAAMRSLQCAADTR